MCGPGSVVGMATAYGMDGQEIESRWGRDFPHPSRPLLGLPSLVYNRYRVFLGGKATRAWHWPPTLSSAEVKERIALFLYSPFGPSWPVLGWTFPFSHIRITISHLNKQKCPFSNRYVVILHLDIVIYVYWMYLSISGYIHVQKLNWTDAIKKNVLSLRNAPGICTAIIARGLNYLATVHSCNNAQ